MGRTKLEATLTNRGANRVRSGHPWVYRSDVVEASGEAGDVVRIADRRGRFLGQAFFNPRSEISLRVAERTERQIDESWFADRLEKALEYRKSLNIDADAYRILHAEADSVPGLVVDRYGDYLVLQVGSAAVERRLEWVTGALRELFAPVGILARNDSAARKKEGLNTGVRVLAGELPESTVVQEGSVRYRADLRSGQKTGGFLDQRENHLDATLRGACWMCLPTLAASRCTRRVGQRWLRR